MPLLISQRYCPSPAAFVVFHLFSPAARAGSSSQGCMRRVVQHGMAASCIHQRGAEPVPPVPQGTHCSMEHSRSHRAVERRQVLSLLHEQAASQLQRAAGFSRPVAPTAGAVLRRGAQPCASVPLQPEARQGCWGARRWWKGVLTRQCMSVRAKSVHASCTAP